MFLGNDGQHKYYKTAIRVQRAARREFAPEACLARPIGLGEIYYSDKG